MATTHTSADHLWTDQFTDPAAALGRVEKNLDAITPKPSENSITPGSATYLHASPAPLARTADAPGSGSIPNGHSNTSATLSQTEKPPTRSTLPGHSSPTAEQPGTAGQPQAPTADYLHNPEFRSTEADRLAYRTQAPLYDYDADRIRRITKYDPKYQDIPEEDLASIRGYTGGNWHKEVNRALRAEDSDALAHYGAHIRTAVSGLNQLPVYEGEVYRGVLTRSDMEALQMIDTYRKGTILTEKGFTSASLMEGDWGGQIQLSINSLTGREVHDLALNPEEGEVVFLPGTKFRVEDVQPHPSLRQWHVKLTEVR